MGKGSSMSNLITIRIDDDLYAEIVTVLSRRIEEEHKPLCMSNIIRELLIKALREGKVQE